MKRCLILLIALAVPRVDAKKPPASTVQLVDSKKPLAASQILLQRNGEGRERVFVTDRGPFAGIAGARLVEVGSVTLYWVKPTYKDLIVVRPDKKENVLTWNAADFAGKPQVERDGGLRGGVFVQWTPESEAIADDVMAALMREGQRLGGAVEPVAEANGGQPGVAVFAVPKTLSDQGLLKALRKAHIRAKLKVAPRQEGD